ncbi:hypothetical protein NL676_033228 [Syzygium grande]|nr:hypothetical protein NL676_033228 [Syzygium grande]
MLSKRRSLALSLEGEIKYGFAKASAVPGDGEGGPGRRGLTDKESSPRFHPAKKRDIARYHVQTESSRKGRRVPTCCKFSFWMKHGRQRLDKVCCPPVLGVQDSCPPVLRGRCYGNPSLFFLKPPLCTPVQHIQQEADAGIICEPCNGKGWLVCDFCKGQKTNVKAENKRIYRRCPSCRAIGFVLCLKCKVYKCVTFPDSDDGEESSL